MKIGQLVIASVFVLLWSEVTFAHAPLHYNSMKPRTNADNSKTNVAGIDGFSCGGGTNATPGAVQHTLKAGDTFKVEFIETIDHPAKYLIDLISLDPANDPLSDNEPMNVVLSPATEEFDDDMTFPKDMANKIDRDQNPRNIPNGEMTNILNGDTNSNYYYSYTVKIPEDVKCEKCALRLMQKMYDGNAANEQLRGTVYSHCTDVKIMAFTGDDTGSGGDTVPEKVLNFKVIELTE